MEIISSNSSTSNNNKQSICNLVFVLLSSLVALCRPLMTLSEAAVYHLRSVDRRCFFLLWASFLAMKDPMHRSNTTHLVLRRNPVSPAYYMTATSSPAVHSRRM